MKKLKLTLLGKALLCYFIVLTLIASLFLFAYPSFAARQVDFTWTPNQENTDGYKIVVDGGNNVVLDIPGHESNTAAYIIDTDTVCHTFAIFAYNAAGESLLSDFVPVCPETPAAVSSFLVTIVKMDD